jgi:SAM-dependent methyltransferase
MATGNQATAFWDREVDAHSHVSWMENLAVRQHINTLISGDLRLWPVEWFEQTFASRLPFKRALSIGCGQGMLERQLVARGICKRVDALDGSLASLAVASAAAAKEGVRIGYFAADFDGLVLPRACYDAVFFHHSLHHVTKLERLFRELRRSMKPGAILYIDEYVGPSRLDWNDELLAPHRKIFAAIPPHQRRGDELPLPIQQDDPSEAVRSSEILPQLRIGFDTLAQRDYGGNVLSVLYPMVAPEPSLIEDLIEHDAAVIRSGERSYHTVLVATPKAGLRGFLSTARYWLEPKWRTLRYNVLRFLTKRDTPW